MWRCFVHTQWSSPEVWYSILETTSITSAFSVSTLAWLTSISDSMCLNKTFYPPSPSQIKPASPSSRQMAPLFTPLLQVENLRVFLTSLVLSSSSSNALANLSDLPLNYSLSNSFSLSPLLPLCSKPPSSPAQSTVIGSQFSLPLPAFSLFSTQQQEALLETEVRSCHSPIQNFQHSLSRVWFPYHDLQEPTGSAPCLLFRFHLLSPCPVHSVPATPAFVLLGNTINSMAGLLPSFHLTSVQRGLSWLLF